MGQSRATPLAGKPAAARETGPGLGSIRLPRGGCRLHFLVCQLLGGLLLVRGNGNPEMLRHLPPKTQLASKRTRGPARKP